MYEPRMPTTLPSFVDRAEFRFVAVDAAGRAWRWSDEKLVWERVAGAMGFGNTADSRSDLTH